MEEEEEEEEEEMRLGRGQEKFAKTGMSSANGSPDASQLHVGEGWGWWRERERRRREDEEGEGECESESESESEREWVEGNAKWVASHEGGSLANQSSQRSSLAPATRSEPPGDDEILGWV